MTDDELKKKRIALLGVGIENRALGQHLVCRGVRFSVCDTRESGDLAELMASWGPSVDDWHVGAEYLQSIREFDIIFRTPGVSPLTPALLEATAGGAAVSSQTRLFFERCPAPILAVTGTKGKGTTVSLLEQMLLDGPCDRVWLGGNIGRPPIEFLDDLSTEDLVLLELSSFQLQDLDRSPHIAVLLNIFDDHLDYHADRAEYIEAKQPICRFQGSSDYMISNADSPLSVSFKDGSLARQLSFSLAREVEEGAFVSGDHLLLRRAGQAHEVCAVADVPLLGTHNLANVAAAVTAAAAAGAAVETIADGIRSFEGLEHRLELIGQLGGVSYYNDSLATIPEATIAAIESFSGPVHLIAGGSSKGADFAELARAATRRAVETVALIGAEADRIETALDRAGYSRFTVRCRTLEAAVHAATERAQPGDVVLLSPACASFGMFDNYAERGREFKRLVEAGAE